MTVANCMFEFLVNSIDTVYTCEISYTGRHCNLSVNVNDEYNKKSY